MLAEVDGHAVVARQGNVLVCAFHPELTDDLRLHALFWPMSAISTERHGGRGDEPVLRDQRAEALARILVELLERR